MFQTTKTLFPLLLTALLGSACGSVTTMDEPGACDPMTGEACEATLCSSDSECEAADPDLPICGGAGVCVARCDALDCSLTINFTPTVVLDERDDVITFDASGAPVHDSDGAAEVVLGMPDTCPDVYKYANRITAEANPIAFRFEAKTPVDEIDPAQAAFRLRARGAAEWQTEWLTAEPAGDDTEGPTFEAIVSRLDLEELATTGGQYEIQVRAASDAGEIVTSDVRCFENHPMAPPLLISSPVLADTAPQHHTLEGRRLGDGSSEIAPLLNGTELGGLVQVTVTNGTDFPAYISVDPIGGRAVFSKEWRVSNARTSINLRQCNLSDGSCGTLTTATSLNAAMVSAFENLGEIVGVFDPAGEPLAPCAACDANQYRLEAGRKYTLALFEDNFDSLRPKGMAELTEEFFDLTLSFMDAFGARTSYPITGELLGQTTICTQSWVSIDGVTYCTRRETYQRYRALEYARINLVGGNELGFHVETRAGESSAAGYPIDPALPDAAGDATVDSFLWEMPSIGYMLPGEIGPETTIP